MRRCLAAAGLLLLVASTAALSEDSKICRPRQNVPAALKKPASCGARSSSGLPCDCFFGLCVGFCGSCQSAGLGCGDHGKCNMRPVNATVAEQLGVNSSGGFDIDGVDWRRASFVPAKTAGQDWVMYCQCEEGYVGTTCGDKKSPMVPVTFALVGLVVTTVLGFGLAGFDKMFACTPGSSDTLELDSEPAEAVRYVVLGQLLEYIAMGSGAFAYSIAWDREAWIVIAIRSVTRLFVDGFSVLANLILPPDWTRKDAYTIKLTFASALPILFVMRFLSLAPKVGGKRQFGSFDRMVAFQLLPMLTIPIIGTYFTPIVGCHFLLGDVLEYDAIAAEATTARPAPMEDMFLPESQRTQCDFGVSTDNFFYLAAVLLIPYWIVSMYVGIEAGKTETKEGETTFPIKVAYFLWHSQILVVIAMSYRAFKRYNPRILTVVGSLLLIGEIVILALYRPHVHRTLNISRIAFAAMALIWWVCAAIAAFVDDPDSIGPVALLGVAMLGWVAGVGAFWKMFGQSAEGGDVEMQDAPSSDA